VLLSFRLANFRSFRDEQAFSFVRGSYTSPIDETTPANGQRPWDQRVGTVAGLYGANASGKSNVLKALVFMRNAVRNSFQNWSPGSSIPVDPFKLDPTHKDEPSLFEAIFVINKVRYQYGFRMTSREVVGEWLYAYPSGRRQIWFERDVSADETYYFGKQFTGRNRVIADLTRPNSLFLSAAVANNHKRVRMVNHWFDVHLTSVSPEDQAARTEYTANMSDRDERWKQVTELMQFADLGICTARVRKEQMAEAERERLRRLFGAVAITGSRDDRQEQEFFDRSSRVIEFGHSTGDAREPVYLPLSAESLGTQVWFSLIGPAIRAINNSDTLLVDELDASLHPHLTSEILKIFRDPSKNAKQAQLIFTSHDTTLLGSLLGDRELRRDQVWFTEKKRDGASILYPLTDFAPRKSENLERGYLQGRYGAVPYLDEEVLSGALSQTDSSERHNGVSDDGAGTAEDDLS
jgi:energy-coupling factor transporter ATP-binding protein EcfA2